MSDHLHVRVVMGVPVHAVGMTALCVGTGRACDCVNAASMYVNGYRSV